MRKTLFTFGFLSLLFVCFFILESNSQAHAAKATLYYKYICQKCGYTIVVAKTNVPPNNPCREGGKHRYKRTAVK